MTKPKHPINEIEFKSTARYVCPTCQFSTTIIPCVGCYARQAKASQQSPPTGRASPQVAPRAPRRAGGR